MARVAGNSPARAGPVALEDELEEVSLMMDATKSNFWEQSNDLIDRIPQASWIAIDEEMTGICLPGNKGTLSKDETPAARYPSLKQVSERYTIIQLGISLFQQVAPQKFHVYRYKFTLFPSGDVTSTREVVLSPGSVKFLSEGNNCNLNEWIQEGIPYCTGDLATKLLEQFRQKQLEKQTQDAAVPSPQFQGRRKVELTRHEDRDFHAKAMATLREWLDSAIVVPAAGPESEGASLLLPACNSFLRRALYESIPAEYPNLVLETHQSQIRVWRCTAPEKARRNRRLLKEGFENVVCGKVGAWRVFLALTRACQGLGPQSQAEHMALSKSVDEALEDWDPSAIAATPRRKIPLVVHNGLQDLLFLLTHFHSEQLPESWEDCKHVIHSYFPVVYDTKVMAKDYCDRDVFQGRTYLSSLYEYTVVNHPQWNRVFSTVQGNAQLQEQLHDAGYDSYCTGAAFYGLAAQLHQQIDTSRPAAVFPVWECTDEDDDEIRWRYGRNLLYFHLSPYTIDLESHSGNGGDDPLTKGMSHCSTFRVDNIDPSVSTRDIVRCLSNLTDSNGQRVNFEIIWIHDVCFLVGVMLADDRNDAKFQEHGQIIWRALKGRFHKATIEPLNAAAVSETASTPSIWNLWGLLARATANNKSKRSRPDDPASHLSAKRRRLA